MEYAPTIGLEIHSELKTKTKMFCGSLNDSDETQPNKNICPVCMGHPGTLPAINDRAVKAVIQVGLALGGSVSAITKFDRKNYFYPDLPKGYQISQYDEPLVSGGNLMGTRIRRVHLEEDTGRLVHERSSSASSRRPVSLVDFNRAGVPLMELVTEPDFKSGGEVLAFVKELQLILRYLEVSDADMEKGQLRIEANVSLNMGTKVELKNINSFKAVNDAIDHELLRQEGILKDGGAVRHETRGWDDAKRKTVSQRHKEEAHDYRYFPEPDLTFLETKLFGVDKLKNSLPELPKEKRERFEKEYGFSAEQAALLVEDKDMAHFYEKSESELAQYEQEEREKSEKVKEEHALLFNYLTSDLRGLMKDAGVRFEELKITPENFAELVNLISDGHILSRQAKDILSEMFVTGGDPSAILDEKNLHTVSGESELVDVVQEVIKKNPDAVADYKKGKEASIQFLIGKSMAKLKGRGDPAVLKKLLVKNLT